MKLPVLLYDDKCTMCLRFKEALEKLDTNETIHFCSVYDENIYNEFPFLTKEACLETVHLVGSDQKVYQGAEIVEVLQENIPMIKKISWLLEKEATKKALNFFYDKINELKNSKMNPCPGCKKK